MATPGAMTFLFTDIEGSTRLWESYPDVMPTALGAHFKILGDTVAGTGGSVVSDTGDGVFAVFPSAAAAVRAAVDAQRGLAGASWGVTGPLRVRMGIHSGHAERGHDDYHGTEVNRCARLMAIAHGGQVITSAATHALVRADPPDGISFLDLGDHRLKDLSQPEHVHQVVHPDLPAAFPPLRSLGAFPNNLPAALSSFVGRTAELAAVQDAVDRSRLVTLTGAGGAGKTRLALQVAADRIERHPNGVWLVDLASLSDPTLVAQVVAGTMRLPDLPGRPAIEALTTFLAERDALLILDNCEHVIAAAADVAERVLRAAPAIRFVATSREPLNVPGEVSWRVPSLSLADPTTAEVPTIERSEAVALFLDRAAEGVPGFTPTADQLAIIATICHRLDGLPLAIELAAARVRTMAIEDISTRLHDRFALLTGGARTALPRQRTLEAAVAWSYDLLDPDEQQLFARLSVFAGSFALTTAEEVCAGGPIEHERILDLLPRLVDKSMVGIVHGPDGARYRLLETLRDYARVRQSTDPAALSVREAHLRWATSFAETAGMHMLGPDHERWFRDISASFDDLRAALDRSIETGEPATGLRIMTGLFQWWPVAAVGEARRWLERLLVDESGIEPALLGRSLSLYGVILGIHGASDEAAAALERALPLLVRSGDRRAEAWAKHFLGIDTWEAGPPDRVKALTMEALAMFEELREPVGVLRCLWWLVLWELEFGTLDEALGYGRRLAALAASIPTPLAGAHAAEAAGLLARVQGDIEEAGRELREAVRLHAKARNVICLSHCLEHVALWSLDRADATQAATILGTVDAIRDDLLGRAAVPSFERMWHDRAVEGARTAIGPDAYEAAWQRGRSMTIEQAIRAGMRAVGLSAAGAEAAPVTPG